MEDFDHPSISSVMSYVRIFLRSTKTAVKKGAFPLRNVAYNY